MTKPEDNPTEAMIDSKALDAIQVLAIRLTPNPHRSVTDTAWAITEALRPFLAMQAARPTVDATLLSDVVKEACRPWEYCVGDPPEWDSPLGWVYDAGVSYALARLADVLGVSNYTPCDGSETYEGDVSGTAGNILRASHLVNGDGDILSADEVTQSQADSARIKALEEALKPFAGCCDQISDEEDDEEWAKFRLLVKDYRRACATLNQADGGVHGQ